MPLILLLKAINRKKIKSVVTFPLISLASLSGIPWSLKPFYHDFLDEFEAFYKPNTTNGFDNLNASTKLLNDYLFHYPTEKVITALIRNTSSIYYSRFVV